MVITRHVGIGSNSGQFMNDIAYGLTLGFLIVMQWLLIWQCIKTRGHVTANVSDLGTEMVNIGTLLDEALDFIADMPSPAQGIVANTLQSPDIKEMLLGALMSKISMAPEHGSKEEVQRTIQETDETHE